MLQYILGGVVMFIIFFCVNYFFGLSKNKDGKKSVGLALVASLAATVAATVAWWIVVSVL